MDGPIFIVGAPRSGTTLLRAILNRHPAIELCDETGFFYKVWSRRGAFGDLASRQNRLRLVRQYVATKTARATGIEPHDLSNALLNEGVSYRDFFTTLIRQNALRSGKARFGEKTPYHAFFAETLCNWYPRCALIHIVRDPRDVAASLKRVPFGSPEALANARSWAAHVNAAMRAERRANYILVKYEDFVREPEAELRRLLAFVSEDWAPGMLDARTTAEQAPWWSKHAYRALQQNRAGAWRRELTAPEISLIEWAAGATMSGLGYEPEARAPTRLAVAAAMTRTGLNYLSTRLRSPATLWYYWVARTNLADDDAAWAKREPRGRRSSLPAGKRFIERTASDRGPDSCKERSLKAATTPPSKSPSPR